MRLFLVLAFCCLVVIAAGQSACETQRGLVKDYGKPDDFMPTCDPNGDYAQVQCRSGWCWCAKKDGKQLTKSVQGQPDCTGKPR